jgi:hypothetical protein
MARWAEPIDSFEHSVRGCAADIARIFEEWRSRREREYLAALRAAAQTPPK